MLQKAAWTLDLEDVRIYYDGPVTDDAYAIRTWVMQHITDLGIQHALLDKLLPYDRCLQAPELLQAINAQMDEAGEFP